METASCWKSKLIDKACPIAVADWTVQNLGTKEEFLAEVDVLIDKILEKNKSVGCPTACMINGPSNGPRFEKQDA